MLQNTRRISLDTLLRSLNSDDVGPGPSLLLEFQGLLLVKDVHFSEKI